MDFRLGKCILVYWEQARERKKEKGGEKRLSVRDIEGERDGNDRPRKGIEIVFHYFSSLFKSEKN